MSKHRYTGVLALLFSLSMLLAACGTDTTTGNNPTPTAGSTPAVTATTQPVPPTRTDCPSAGTARTLITASLVLGSHQTIVFVHNEANNYIVVASELLRYDVTTGKKTLIVKYEKAQQTLISEAQVSADGEWTLFVTSTPQQTELQAVRVDGQGLQTLYCSSQIRNVQWSSNQKYIVFTTNDGLFLLNTVTGTVNKALQAVNSGAPLNMDTIATPFTWLDTTRLYVTYSSRPIAPTDTLGWFDVSQGANQPWSAVKSVYVEKETGNYPCWDADSSYDGTTLFVAQCHGTVASNVSGSGALGGRSGPGSLSMEAAKGGTRTSIFSSATMGIKTVRAISKDTLLLLVENYREHQVVDSSQNGLWKINSDGSGLTRLTTSEADQRAYMNLSSQSPWANVSRSGDLYALYVTTINDQTMLNGSLVYGKLSGGETTTFASVTTGQGSDSIAGWTTM